MFSPLPAYAELHCLSNYSFLRGASSPEELVTRAAELDYKAIAITDECSLAGVVRAHQAAKSAGIKLIIGSEFRLLSGEKVIALARNREGYGNISELITFARRNEKKGKYRLTRDDISANLSDCVVILALSDDATTREGGIDSAHWFAKNFPGRAWLAAHLLSKSGERAKLRRLTDISKIARLPLTACGDVHMHRRSRRRLQDVLTAIRLGKTLSECGHELFPNAERHLRHRLRISNLYPSSLIRESVAIADSCRFSLDELRYEYPEEVVPKGHSPASYLRSQTLLGLSKRYPDAIPQQVINQVEHELSLIHEKYYEPYFLTVYDIVAFAQKNGILCQGRGSAANSAVCYALGITEVDPARSNLLFERFISRERNEPPDIDIDFEHERREEVIQYIYQRYGRDRAALAATVITYRVKSAIRDVGRTLGIDESRLRALAKAHAWWDDKTRLVEAWQEQGFDPQSALTRRFLDLVSTVIGFPRHLSQHVGGFVISRGPLSRLVPIENAAMPARTVIQWEKEDLENIGLMKVDILGLGMLTAIRRTLGLLKDHCDIALKPQDIPSEDAEVFKAIQKADTVGVFQIESRAQMSMLPRLKPANFYDLVIEVAIVRPGPIQGGMVHPYLRRKQGKESVTYPSNAVKSVLERTLGVPIFQEQVMQIAMIAAGFTPGEADQLRRAMAAWKRKGGLEPFEAKLKVGMATRGYSPEFAEGIYQQILGFGDYGFPESHSASFALLTYMSAWLKFHHPAAFLAGLLNSQPMGFYAPSQLVQDARRHWVEILPTDVNQSLWYCTLENPHKAVPAVRLGLLMIKGISKRSAERIVNARQSGQFESIQNLAERAQLVNHELEILAGAGALQGLSLHRRDALWAALGVQHAPPIFPSPVFHEQEITLEAPAESDNLLADYRHLSLTLGRHPLALLRGTLSRHRIVLAEAFPALRHGSRVSAAGLVVGRQRPDTASGVIFVTLEDESGFVNVVVWRRLAERQRRELLGARLLFVHGTVESVDGVTHLIAMRLIDRSDLLGKLNARSRDFH